MLVRNLSVSEMKFW